jgi:hypothetical protein
MKIETNTTINVKIGDYEFNLTKEEAEELYNSLKNSLGKNDNLKRPNISPKDFEDFKKKWQEPINPPYQTGISLPAVLPNTSILSKNDIWCKSNKWI